MPPKKIFKLDNKQQTLGQLWQSNSEEHGGVSETSCNQQDSPDSDENEPGPSRKSSESQPDSSQSKKREFLTKWLSMYSWLRFVKKTEEQAEFMYCSICDEHNAKNSMIQSMHNRNFQNTTLLRHARHPDHVNAVRVVPQMKQSLAVVLQKGSSDQDKAIEILFKTLEWLIKEDLPLSKFQSLVHLLHDFNVKDLEILNKSKINYQSPESVNDFLDCLAEDAWNKVTEKLKKSEFVTVLTDESTDISNQKRQVIYAQVLNENFMPETLFISNVECVDASGAGIAKTVLSEMAKRGVDAKKIMSLGSDGAAAMTGKEKGAAAIMRRSNPHMQNVHCIAHRLALCTSQGAEKVPLLKKHQQVLTDLFYYFKVSLDNCREDLQKVCTMETPYLQKLKIDLTGVDFKGHRVTTTNFNLENLAKLFIENVTQNLDSRFPSEELISSFGVLSLRPISLMSKNDVDQYGERELEILTECYGKAKSISWKTDGQMQTASSDPIINPDEAKTEWKLVKRVVLAEQYPRDKITSLWQLINQYHRDQFPNLLKLASLALTSAVHTAGCERGFSTQNRILTKSRNRLSVIIQDKLMAVKLKPGAVDYHTLIQLWRSKKDRRVYEFK